MYNLFKDFKTQPMGFVLVIIIAVILLMIILYFMMPRELIEGYMTGYQGGLYQDISFTAGKVPCIPTEKMKRCKKLKKKCGKCKRCLNYKKVKGVCMYDTGSGCNMCTVSARGVGGCKKLCTMYPCNPITEMATTIH